MFYENVKAVMTKYSQCVKVYIRHLRFSYSSLEGQMFLGEVFIKAIRKR